MSDTNEFVIAVKYKNRVGIFENFTSNQEAEDFRDGLKKNLPDCEILIGERPKESNTDPEVHDHIKDFKEGKVIKISFCESCGSSEYILKPVGDAEVNVCAKCGNNTWK
ncbi:MAG: hypothetical protein ACTSVL_06340 [Promethearchaeota archaeon]